MPEVPSLPPPDLALLGNIALSCGKLAVLAEAQADVEFAAHFLDRLKVEYEELLKTAAAHEDVALFVQHGERELRVTNIRARNPKTVIIDGRDSRNRRVALIQHVSQVSVLAVMVPKDLTAPGAVVFN